MRSDKDSEADISTRIQRALLSVNSISLKIKKELEMIEELVRKDGHLHTVVNTANEALIKKVQEKGINSADIIKESESNSRRLEPNMDLITSTIITEKLLDQINA